MRAFGYLTLQTEKCNVKKNRKLNTIIIMKNFWWIVSVVTRTTGWDGSRDGESYPVQEKKVYKFFGLNDQNTYKNFQEQISADHTYGSKKLDFIWCLAEEGNQEPSLEEELREYLKKEMKLS